MSNPDGLLSEDVKRHFRERVRETVKKIGIRPLPLGVLEIPKEAGEVCPACGGLNKVVKEQSTDML